MVNCPDWNDRIPADRLDEFNASVREVYQQIATSARTSVIGPDEPKDWHALLFRRFVPIAYYAGNYRQDDVSRVCLGQNVRVGTESGSPFQVVLREINVLFEEFRVTLARTEISWSAISPTERARRVAIILATLIGRFIKIHPFINGNGRVSRLLWAWGLLRLGVPIQCRIAPRPELPYGPIMSEAMTGNYGLLALYILQHLAAYPPRQTV